MQSTTRIRQAWGRAASLRRGVLVVSIAAVIVGVTAPAVAAPSQPAQLGTVAEIRLMAINDFHGALEPPTGASGRVAQADGTSVDAGGAAYLASFLKQLRGQNPNSLLISAGDNIGASPLASGLFHDEPTIEFLNSVGLRASAIGNHELDEGYGELRRLETGGCHPVDGCDFRESFSGANFAFLAANLSVPSEQVAPLPYTIAVIDGISVGVIGVTLEAMASVVSPDALTGLGFTDELAAVNATADTLNYFGVRTIALAVHDGAQAATGGPNSCNDVTGPARDLAEAASPLVDVVFSAHSHQQYNCAVTDPAGNQRPLIQGASNGRLISVVDVKVDRITGDVIRQGTNAFNQVVSRDIAPDPATTALVGEAVTKAAPQANRALGTIAADLPRAQGPSGESPLGNVVADSQLAATASAGAQLALVNPGGIRSDLLRPGSPEGGDEGVVTYGEAFAVQPFGNTLSTVTLSGAQLKATLEQQFRADGEIILAPSAGLRYRVDRKQELGSRVSAVTVSGEPLADTTAYRVTVNSFLAAGGDGFSTLTAGSDATSGPGDLAAFETYLAANPQLAPPALDRIAS